MIPIHLAPGDVRCALVGRGALAVRRLAWLRDAGADPDIWSDSPSAELESAANGARMFRRLPRDVELTRYHAIWVADLPEPEAEKVAGAARIVRVLVNVEDVPALCDFHTPALLRQGRLLLSVGTGGSSPAVARAVRERLEAAFPPSWGEALDEIAHARTQLRLEGADATRLIADARERLAARGLA